MQSIKTHFNWRTTSSIPNRVGFGASIFKRGFTLIEMVVTLSIIAILAVVITTQFSGDSAKAAKILSNSETIKRASLRFKMDTGYYPCSTWLLYGKGNDTAEVSSEHRACKRTTGPTWNGPYIAMDAHPLGQNSISAGVDNAVTFVTQKARGWGGAPESRGIPYVVYTRPVSQGIAIEFMKKCTGTEAWADQNLENGKCSIELYSQDQNLWGLYLFVGYIK